MPKRAPNPQRDLFLISFTILFFELACIRFFGSTVVFLTFFTNIVLMASFLGMSIGLLTARQKRNFVRMVMPACLLAMALGWAVLLIYQNTTRLGFDVGSQQSPQQIYFGAEYTVKDPLRFMVPIEVVAGAFFVLVALPFVGLGQVMGRAFNAISDRVQAYTVDIAGSISGIVCFALLSYLRAPPVFWFAIVVCCCLNFIRPLNFMQIAFAAALLLISGAYSVGAGDPGQVHWSPYYKVVFYPQDRTIWTNNLGHQSVRRVPEERAAMYMLPHDLARAGAHRTFDDVLVIGAGSGNDLSAALLRGARHIDAVEIDPVIHELGEIHHPNHPYSDPRVTIHLDDGRSFLRKTDEKYDLVVYALVDSLVLHSGYSSLRLESFLFTREAIGDVKKVLKPDGVFAMYNLYRQGWVVGRLATLAQQEIGGEPLVISLPYQPIIRAADNEFGKRTFILTDMPRTDGSASTVQQIRAMLAADETSSGPWQKDGVGASQVDTADIGPIPSDDWPFLYLRQSFIPALNIRGMIMIVVLSIALLWLFAPLRTARLNWTMFFLGAGFMLLETKGVVHMALLFGATWIVNSIVFAAILIMILCANLFVLRMRPKKLWPYFVLLIASLLINALVPMHYFLSLSSVSKIVVSCAMVFLPIFFAGIIFATFFRDSRNPDQDFGSNVAGIILGGVSESFSLVLGFNHLLFIAIGFYALSAIFRPRH